MSEKSLDSPEEPCYVKLLQWNKNCGMITCRKESHSLIKFASLPFFRNFFFGGGNSLQWAMASSFTRFLDHKQ